MNLSIEIRAALQLSLLKNLSYNVRGICCDWDDNYAWFRLRFYLNIEPNDEERELMSVVLTEFEGYMQEFKKYYEECVYAPESFSELDKLRMVILWRDE